MTICTLVRPGTRNLISPDWSWKARSFLRVSVANLLRKKSEELELQWQTPTTAAERCTIEGEERPPSDWHFSFGYLFHLVLQSGGADHVEGRFRLPQHSLFSHTYPPEKWAHRHTKVCFVRSRHLSTVKLTAMSTFTERYKRTRILRIQEQTWQRIKAWNGTNQEKTPSTMGKARKLCIGCDYWIQM